MVTKFLTYSCFLSKASHILLKGDHYENTNAVEEESSSDSNLCNKYLHQVVSVLASDCTGGISKCQHDYN